MRKTVSLLAAGLLAGCSCTPSNDQGAAPRAAEFARIACLDFNGTVVYQAQGRSSDIEMRTSGRMTGVINGQRFSATSGGGCLTQKFNFDPNTPAGIQKLHNLEANGKYAVVITNSAGVVISEFRANGHDYSDGGNEFTLGNGEVHVYVPNGASVFVDEAPQSRFIAPRQPANAQSAGPAASRP